jgi:LmbE family N-acetylglucosaminyl deacetylase
MNKEDKILIISPHPDDEALDSGGLIMRAKAEGIEVFVFYVSTGGSRQFQNGQTNESDRINEASEAGSYGGFEYEIGFSGTSTKLDGMLQKEIIEAIEDIVQDFKPTIVVIPYRDSYSQDHRAVASASISAFRPIPQELHHQPRMILEVEEPSAWPKAPNPNFYVDISSYIEGKIGLYNRHKSQVTKEPSVRSVANLINLAFVRGSEIGVQFAEAYTLLKGQL